MASKHAHHTFRFTVLGRYPARLKDNRPAVTVNLAAGQEGKVVYCGTLTMAEDEWETLLEALRRSMKDSVEVDDHTVNG